MSTFKVPLTTVLEVSKHPNADNLELVKVYDYDVITSKDKYKPGDYVIYIPVGSVLPAWLEEITFPPNSKVKLNKSRIRAIKLRGLISQGLLVVRVLFQVISLIVM